MKTVLITGAGRGIGLALCKEFLAGGYRVIGTYRTAGTSQELLKLEKESTHLKTIIADVSQSESLTELKAEIKKNSPLDIVINNSGVIGEKGRSLLELDIDKISGVLDVNTLGPMRICKVAVPHLKGGGTIAQISSLMGSIADNASGGYYDYRMSKSALNMFNMCLAREFKNLNCLVLHPGWVQTDMGGSGANVTVKESATGLYNVITNASSKQTGKFFDYKGKELPW